MNFKRIMSTILSIVLISSACPRLYATDITEENIDNAVEKQYQTSEENDTKKVPVKKDPIYWGILAAGAAWLAHGIYKDYQGIRIEGSNLTLPGEFMGFDWNDFSEACHRYVVIIRNPEFPINNYFDSNFIDFYHNHIERYMDGDRLRLRDFQLSLFDEYLTPWGTRRHITRDDLELWRVQTTRAFIRIVDCYHLVSTQIQTRRASKYRQKFISMLNRINFSSGDYGSRTQVVASSRFFNCSKVVGWRNSNLDANDKNEDVIRNRINEIFGTKRKTQNNCSLAEYVLGRSGYDHNPRFNELRRKDPSKIDLFTRILKELMKLKEEDKKSNTKVVKSIFEPTVEIINGNCSNEFSQYIDTLAGLLDGQISGSVNITNLDDLADVAITAAKRDALKQSVNSHVLSHISPHRQMLVAEHQIHLYGLLAPVFGLKDGRNFNINIYGGSEFVRLIDEEHQAAMSLCNNFFKNCFEEIGSNITQHISGISVEQSESIYNAMANVHISYNDFKKILNSSHVSNRIASHKSTFHLADGSFDTRFDNFVNSLDTNDEDEKALKNFCKKWKNGTNTPLFKDIVDALSSSLKDASSVYELTMFNGYHNNPAGKTWMGDILIYVYLHCKGVLKVE